MHSTLQSATTRLLLLNSAEGSSARFLRIGSSLFGHRLREYFVRVIDSESGVTRISVDRYDGIGGGCQIGRSLRTKQ